MKRLLNNCKKSLFLIVLLSALSVVRAWAQVPDEETLFEPVTDTPINAGIMVMVAAGIGYGMKKLNSRKK